MPGFCKKGCRSRVDARMHMKTTLAAKCARVAHFLSIVTADVIVRSISAGDANPLCAETGLALKASRAAFAMYKIGESDQRLKANLARQDHGR